MKTTKVNLPELPHLGYGADSDFQAMEWKEFQDYCGGRLATALFKGKLEDELYFVISMATERGILQYHKRLLEEAKK